MLVEGESRSLLIHYIVQWYPEIKSLPFGPRLISKLHERYQEFTLLITQNYGWDTTQETVSYLHLNPSKFNNNNNILQSFIEWIYDSAQSVVDFITSMVDWIGSAWLTFQTVSNFVCPPALQSLLAFVIGFLLIMLVVRVVINLL